MKARNEAVLAAANEAATGDGGSNSVGASGSRAHGNATGAAAREVDAAEEALMRACASVKASLEVRALGAAFAPLFRDLQRRASAHAEQQQQQQVTQRAPVTPVAAIGGSALRYTTVPAAGAGSNVPAGAGVDAAALLRECQALIVSHRRAVLTGEVREFLAFATQRRQARVAHKVKRQHQQQNEQARRPAAERCGAASLESDVDVDASDGDAGCSLAEFVRTCSRFVMEVCTGEAELLFVHVFPIAAGGAAHANATATASPSAGANAQQELIAGAQELVADLRCAAAAPAADDDEDDVFFLWTSALLSFAFKQTTPPPPLFFFCLGRSCCA
jgi:hypothetical protein